MNPYHAKRFDQDFVVTIHWLRTAASGPNVSVNPRMNQVMLPEKKMLRKYDDLDTIPLACSPRKNPDIVCMSIEREFLRRIIPACAIPIAGVCGNH